MDTFGWTVIGSVAGVVAAAAAVAALLPARRKARLPPAHDGPHTEVSGGRGVQVGSGNAQVNQYIQTYIEHQPMPIAFAAGSMVVGEVPQRAREFLPRAELMDRLGRGGLGELLGRALDAGAGKILIGLGGSASTDGGTGALAALGARFLEGAGDPLPSGGGALAGLAAVDLRGRRGVG